MKYYLTTILVLLFCISKINAQDIIEATFGEPSPEDFAYTTYDRDPDVRAVVLFERGHVSVEVISQSLRLVKTVHVKIKVLETNGFEGATIHIPYYHTKKLKERVTKIKGITHNGSNQKIIQKNAIYTKDRNEKWSVKSFTFPDVRVGSILEYSYTIETPFVHSYEWEFQGDYPKIYSEFCTEVAGNYSYRIALIGDKKLDFRDTGIKKDCFSVDNLGGSAADCRVDTYVMKDVAVFKEESFMLSKNNYISKIKSELKSSIDFNGDTTNYTKTWDDVDKEFRSDKEMGRQLKHISYFEKNLPSEILNIKEDLERAKAVYYFIQNHFSWNQKYRIFNDIRVKDAYQKKVGNTAEINLALINALRAAKLDVELALSATRSLGQPTRLYPVLGEFNYVLALLKVENQELYLDATDSYTSFGYLPLRALNNVSRVMDFKNGSSWKNITPNAKNVHYIKAALKLNEQAIFTGKVEEEHSGHLAYIKREELESKSRKEFLGDRESKVEYFQISNYRLQHQDSIEENLNEKYMLNMESQTIENKIYFNPFFLMDQFTENPFRMEERNYPVDMGYPLAIYYIMSLEIPENYAFTTAPRNMDVRLPNNLGVCTVNYAISGQVINLRLDLKMSQHHFGPKYYPALKEFFTQVVDIRSKHPIVIEKH